uniref:Reverse transcriptase domain-containing protein n=1 Tax=Tanacetum cinerariifolium TaxID=118510 RepID=A0A6L2LK16_TANCI|nr:reverse transcriptase domain-containing protein [Tanacetum cinerariifolium]
MNEANMKAMQTQIDMVKNELRNEMKNFIQTSLSNQTNEIKNMMASLLQMNTASTSGSKSLPSNTVANPKGELKAITTYSGLVIDGPTVPTPPQSINPKVDERVDETFIDSDLAEYTIKVPPPPVQKYKPPIARDVFVPDGKFTFLADFVIVDYESDPRVPLILGRPFLRTAHALIDVHGEEMILRDGDERLILNMRHDTSSYSNQPQRESINLINVFNNSSEDFLEDLFSNQPSGNPAFSSHSELTSSEVQDDIFNSEGGNVLSEKLLDLDSTEDLHPLLHFDIESNLKEIEFLLQHDIDSSLKDSIDQSNLANLADNVVDSIPEMFTYEHALDYSSPLIFDEYDDDFLEVESDAKNVYDDPFDSKGEKIKESKLLIDELDLPCDFLLFEYDSFISQDFSRGDSKPSTNNEDKIFNPGILIQEKFFEIITRVVQDKKLASSNASLVLEDFDPPFYEPLFFKEVPCLKMLLPFSSENKEKVFKPGIHTSEKVHSSFIPELSHQGYKIFKINQIFKSPMKIFLFFYGKDTHALAIPYLQFYPRDQFKYGGIGSSLASLNKRFVGGTPCLSIVFSNE